MTEAERLALLQEQMEWNLPDSIPGKSEIRCKNQQALALVLVVFVGLYGTYTMKNIEMEETDQKRMAKRSRRSLPTLDHLDALFSYLLTQPSWRHKQSNLFVVAVPFGTRLTISALAKTMSGTKLNPKKLLKKSRKNVISIEGNMNSSSESDYMIRKEVNYNE